MSLERLVEEIRQRSQKELAEERARVEAEKRRIVQDRDRRIAEGREDADRRAANEIAKERAQKVASARLQARKFVYEAREKEMERELGEVRRMLEAYTKTKEYPALVKRMYSSAVDRLGHTVKVSGRKEDSELLESVAGKGFSRKPIPVLGGIQVETANGEQRLDMTFDELLRLRENRIRALLAA
jgi:vacuolar-type H+-ATPase subunit E/Vma4